MDNEWTDLCKSILIMHSFIGITTIESKENYFFLLIIIVSSLAFTVATIPIFRYRYGKKIGYRLPFFKFYASFNTCTHGYMFCIYNARITELFN